MKQRAFLIILAVLIWLLPERTAEAAMATIRLQTSSEVIRVDDEFEVSIVITAQPSEGESSQQAVIGDFEAYLIYDDTIFEFVTAASSCITGGGGNLKISDFGAEPSRESRKYVMRFRALERGSANFSFYTTPNVYVYGGGVDDRMPALTDILELEVLASKSASDNASLSALKVSPGSLTPTFATTLREYSVTIPYAVDMVIVSALTEDENATVSVSGSTGLSVGENKVVVTVTAENGTEKRYYIYVTREKKEEAPSATPEPSVPPGPPEEKTGLHAGMQGSNIVLTFQKSYRVAEDPLVYIAPTGYEETVLFLDGIRIKAYGKRGEEQGEHLVLVLLDEEGNSGYYRYDRREQTLQRFDEERIELRQVVEQDNSGLQAALQKYKNNQVVLIFALALFFSLSITFLLIIIKMYQKYRREEDELDDR